MALTGLLRELQDYDEILASELRESASFGRVDVRETLLQMERSLRSLKSQLGSVPAEQRTQISNRCKDFERHLQGHRQSLERRSHDVSRTRLFNGKPSAKVKPTTHEENEREEVRSLARTRDKMQTELQRMNAITETLEHTSSTIKGTRTQYKTYNSALATASKVLGDLKRKTEDDSKYIWWSFLFFLSVVAYIVLRRMKVFRMIYLGFSWTWWSGMSVVGVGQSIASQTSRCYWWLSNFFS